MPLQNRVTPEGEIVATPHRGLMMGNRGGCFHLPARAPEMDLTLQVERVGARGHKVTYRAQLATLPDGTFVRMPAESAARCYLVDGDRLLPWSAAGYEPPVLRPKWREAEVLTPRSI